MKTNNTKPPFLSPWTKVRLSLFALSAVVAIAGIERVQGRMEGIVEGIHQSDEEALAAFVHFSKPLQAEQVKMRRAANHTRSKPATHSVWAALDGEK